MIWTAFTLGFLGSMHCIGMCGPLALGVARFGGNSFQNTLIHGLSYNFGRIITYSILGVAFGLIGEVIMISGLQKSLSIIAGLILIVLFFMSLDVERLLSKSTWYQSSFQKVSEKLSKKLKTGAQRHPTYIGILNGLLPCGLVYLALAGSLLSGSLLGGFAFMFVFGLGTIPAMLALMILGNRKSSILKLDYIRRALPIIQLAFGAFLIYRGVVIDIPENLNFWKAVNDPIMCH